MCCRYYMEMSPELRPIIEEANRSALKERIVNKLGRPMVTEGEVRPTNIVPVIAPNRSGARTVFPMVWGFTLPRSSSPMVNARMETASTKPTFKESWERRRCIVPASYYFEWEHLINAATGKAKTGDKYMIHPKDPLSPGLQDFTGSRIYPVFRSQYSRSLQENRAKRSDSSMTECRSFCLEMTSKNGSIRSANRMRSLRML